MSEYASEMPFPNPKIPTTSYVVKTLPLIQNNHTTSPQILNSEEP